ncbi:MAG TPA: DUF4434 domain-containing protein [Armatimonadota bacterium]
MKFLFVFAALAAISSAGCAQTKPWPEPVKTPVKNHPIPRGTFIQEYLVRQWTDAKWQAEYNAMKAVGMDIMIFGSAADSKKKVTYYPPSVPGYSLADGYGDVIDACLRNAKKCGVKVFIGLNFSSDWWNKGVSDPEWLYAQMREGNLLADDLYAKYHGKYPDTFAGWYWVWEVDNANYNRADQRDTLAKALDINVSHVHSLDANMPVMLCPFMNYRLGSPEQYRDTWAWVFAHCSLGQGDIFAPQDCVGAGGTTIDNFVPWLAALKQAVDSKPGLRFWTDAETFDQADWTAAPLNRFIRQLKGAQPYVEHSVTFAYSHYYSPVSCAPGWQKTLADYVRTGKLETQPPTPPTYLKAARGTGRIALTWNKSKDNVGVASYAVLRDGVRIARIQASKTSPIPAAAFTDTSAPAGEVRYAVQACDFAGNSSAPAEVTVH